MRKRWQARAMQWIAWVLLWAEPKYYYLMETLEEFTILLLRSIAWAVRLLCAILIFPAWLILLAWGGLRKRVRKGGE